MEQIVDARDGLQDSHNFSQPKHSSYRRSRVLNLNESKTLEPWADNTFELTAYQRQRNEKKIRTFYTLNRQRRKKNSLKEQMNEKQMNPIYKTDTSLETNIQEKIKWRLQSEYVKMQRKKVTELLKMKHYSHSRSSNTSQNKGSIEKNREFIVSDIAKKITNFSKKQTISERLKTAIKFNPLQKQKQLFVSDWENSNLIKYRKKFKKHEFSPIKIGGLELDNDKNKDHNQKELSISSICKIQKKNSIKLQSPRIKSERVGREQYKWRIQKKSPPPITFKQFKLSHQINNNKNKSEVNP